MTAAMQGADVDQLRAAAAVFEAKAQEIDALNVKVSNGVEISAWFGPFAVQWRAMWKSQDARYLRESTEMLRQMAKALKVQAQQQENASRDGSGSGIHLPSPMPVPKPAPKPGPGEGKNDKKPDAPNGKPQDQGSSGSKAAGKAEAWAKGAVGRGINVDGAYGNQCVDVANDYAMYLFPKADWTESMGAPASASQLFDTANATYFDKIPYSATGANSHPQAGDLICFGGTPDNQYGHVAVVEKVENGTITVVEQNGFREQDPAYRREIKTLSGTPVQGYLRPKL